MHLGLDCRNGRPVDAGHSFRFLALGFGASCTLGRALLGVLCLSLPVGGYACRGGGFDEPGEVGGRVSVGLWVDHSHAGFGAVPIQSVQ